MSSEQTYLLRLQSQADKELKTTAVTVTGTPTKFTSQVTQFRKGIAAYNNSDTASGECVWGGSDLTVASGMPIPKGSIVDIPVSTSIDIYFCNTVSGENGDLRVVEIA